MRKCKFTKAAASLPLLYGLCIMWVTGICRRAIDLPLWVDGIGLLGACLGFIVFTYRCFATEQMKSMRK
jgi:hypothetical protein